MARITIIALGTRGDVQPYIALGIGLQNAGHAVRLLTQENFGAMVTQYGLAYEPITGDAQSLVTGQAGLHTLDAGTNPLAVISRLTEVAAPILQQVNQDIISGLHDTDLIFGSALGCFAGLMPAAHMGIPLYPAYVQPGTPTTAYPNPFFPTLFNRTPLAAVYNRLTHRLFQLTLKEVGRRTVARHPGDRFADRSASEIDIRRIYGSSGGADQPYLYGFSPQIVPKPPDWAIDKHITGYWYLDQQRDWQPPKDLLRFLDAGAPPVYIGFGSMSSRNPGAVADLVIRAVQKTGQRAILLTGWGGLDPGALPAEIMVIQSAPHDWLFPRMAAIVHHGGSGTTGEALRSGRPQIVIPFSFDQPFWASRVKAIGVGQVVARRRLTVDRLSTAINRVMTDQPMRDRAAAVGTAVRAEDGVGKAVSVIAAITA